MAGEAIISVTGNLGGDAELRQTPQGIFELHFQSLILRELRKIMSGQMVKQFGLDVMYGAKMPQVPLMNYIKVQKYLFLVVLV